MDCKAKATRHKLVEDICPRKCANCFQQPSNQPSQQPSENSYDKSICENMKEFKFRGSSDKNCEWAGGAPSKRCKKKDNITGLFVKHACPSVCNLRCQCKNSKKAFKIRKTRKSCKQIKRSQCSSLTATNQTVADICPRKCKYCYKFSTGIDSERPSFRPTPDLTIPPSSIPSPSHIETNVPTILSKSPSTTDVNSAVPSEFPTEVPTESVVFHIAVPFGTEIGALIEAITSQIKVSTTTKGKLIEDIEHVVIEVFVTDDGNEVCSHFEAELEINLQSFLCLEIESVIKQRKFNKGDVVRMIEEQIQDGSLQSKSEIGRAHV